MKLIDENKLTEVLRYYNPDSNTEHNFALGIKYGAKWAEEQIKPMFVEFAEYCAVMGIRDVLWITPLGAIYNLDSDQKSCKTTEELFELFLEEQTKK